MELSRLLPTLHCWFHIWGTSLDTEAVTRATGVTPTKAHRPGEGRQANNPKAAHGRHGYWTWKGPVGDDPEPLLDGWHDLFAPVAEKLHGTLAEDDDVTLTLIGNVPSWPVTRIEQIAGMHVVGDDVFPRYNPRDFEPFLDADRIPLVLKLRHLELLTRLRCTFETHIDYDLLAE